MIYEQRIYTCIPGRLPALLKRFEEQTLKIWDKHGIKQAGFWTVLVGDGNHDLHYLLGLGLARRSRADLEHISGRSGLAQGARREREGRADHRQYQEFVPAADGVFRGEMRPVDPTRHGLHGRPR